MFVPGWDCHGTLGGPLHHYQLIRVVMCLIMKQEVLDGSLFNLQRDQKKKRGNPGQCGYQNHQVFEGKGEKYWHLARNDIRTWHNWKKQATRKKKQTNCVTDGDLMTATQLREFKNQRHLISIRRESQDTNISTWTLHVCGILSVV